MTDLATAYLADDALIDPDHLSALADHLRHVADRLRNRQSPAGVGAAPTRQLPAALPDERSQQAPAGTSRQGQRRTALPQASHSPPFDHRGGRPLEPDRGQAVTDLTPADRAPAPRDRELSAAVWDRPAPTVTAALDHTTPSTE